MFETIFFDLDDTLYPRDNGIWSAVRQRIERYILERAGIAAADVARLRDDYLARYGTTLRGLMAHHGVSAEDYLDYVHDVPIEASIQANPQLAAMLRRLPQRKFVFTNASRGHAQRVLAALGVEAQFSGIIAIEDLEFISKPDDSVYPLALELAKSEASGSLYLDDQVRNLAPARRLGLGTVLVGPTEASEAADLRIGRVEELIEALPALVE